MIFIHAVCALVGFVICLFRIPFVNKDCIPDSFLLLTVLMKRIEKTKNRIKAELKFFIQNVDVKQQNFNNFFNTKHKELQQALVRRKRFSDIWVSFDRRENDFLSQEIRTLRTLDEIDPPVGSNESEPAGSEEISINDCPELLDFDFFQFLKSFDFSSIPISAFTTFQK